MKKIVSAVLVFVMMLSLVGCGISYDDIKGDWTAKTINGKTVDEYAASHGVDPSLATVNVNITEDDKLTITNANHETKYDYVRRSNGIEVKEEGKDEVYMTMLYDEDKKTLTYKVDLGNGQTEEYVLEKGKADLTPAQQDAQTQTDGAVEEGATEAVQ
ncbi:MAG: hypothetical protein MSA76_04155 [Clostridium sp.]|nr:hypothetical protein [Clostridium sp.]